MKNNPSESSDPNGRVNRTFGSSGCATCILEKPCGGHPLPIIRRIGCVNYAAAKEPVDTDDMSPLFPERFWDLWDDTDGLLDYEIGHLKGMEAGLLPKYVPMLQHSKMRRSKYLEASIVALPLFDVIGMRRDGTYGSKFKTAFELRTAYRLKLETKIVLVGVDIDKPIETFWREHRVSHVFEELKNLDIIGVTVPNFSFFTDVPMMQILRNRKRLLLVAEVFSKAGISVAPHINAISDGDWNAALDLLRKHQEITTISMEFQTGARFSNAFGQECVDRIISLQGQLGRPLHPILVGGGRYFQQADRSFPSFSVIDSQPFMQSISRQLLTKNLGGHWEWISNPTPKGASLGELFSKNLENYPLKLNSSCEDGIKVGRRDPKQLELPLNNSTPNLGSQPRARGISETKPEAVSFAHC